GPVFDAVTAGGWTASQSSALPGELSFSLTGYAVVQLVLFAVVAGIASWPPIRRALTPRFLKRHRVRKAAFHHFAAAHSYATESAGEILIFVALGDPRVEVRADGAIHARGGDSVWREAANSVQGGMRQPDPTAGIERAVEICGAALKAHFPSDKRGAGVDRP